MRITVTGQSELANRAAEALAGEHTVRTAVDPGARVPPAGVEGLAGDLRDPEFAEQVVEGSDVLVHLAPLGWAEAECGSDLEAIDRATRGTYVLLSAARRAGVRRVVLG